MRRCVVFFLFLLSACVQQPNPPASSGWEQRVYSQAMPRQHNSCDAIAFNCQRP